MGIDSCTCTHTGKHIMVASFVQNSPLSSHLRVKARDLQWLVRSSMIWPLHLTWSPPGQSAVATLAFLLFKKICQIKKNMYARHISSSGLLQLQKVTLCEMLFCQMSHDSLHHYQLSLWGLPSPLYLVLEPPTSIVTHTLLPFPALLSFTTFITIIWFLFNWFIVFHTKVKPHKTGLLLVVVVFLNLF